MKVYCVFSLESPRRGDSNKYTIYHFNIKKKIILNYPKYAAMVFSRGLKNEFETAVVNGPSVFEPLKVYCTCFQVVSVFSDLFGLNSASNMAVTIEAI